MAKKPTYQELEQRIKKLEKQCLERQRVEEELRESEQKYRTLFEHSGFCITVFDPRTGKRVAFNRKASERLGYTREEFKKLTTADVDCNMTAAELKQHAADVVEKGPDLFETKHMTKNGRALDTLVSSVPIWIHGKPFIQTIHVDITEQKRAQKELEEQTAQNQLILETAMDGFLVISMEGKILQANRAASTLYGYSQDELIGMAFSDLEVEQTPQEIGEHIKTIMKKGSNRFEISHRRKDGRIIDVEFSSNYVVMNGQRFFFAFLHDVTARKRAEQGLMQREEELEIKARDLEEVNAALRVLLKRRDEDKRELEEKVLFNVRQLIVPYLERLKKSNLNKQDQTFVSILESNLNEIISPLSYRLSSAHLNLTPAELQTANFVKHGRTSKEIAEFLHLSSGTIETHRKNIRRKIGIKNKKANLRTHLLSMQ
jgi:PAS domain S-box-containing protein